MAARRSARCGINRRQRIVILHAVEFGSGTAALSGLTVVDDVLAGRTAVLPVPAGDADHTATLTAALRAGEQIDDRVAVVLSTSGTTGTPKGAMLSASALAASAEATHRRLGGPGRWLLALPAYHVAGFQVLVRSVVAGTEPVAVPASFDEADLGQRVVAAVVVPEGASITLADLKSHLADVLPATAAPRQLHIVDALPRKGIGKVDRRELVRLFS